MNRDDIIQLFDEKLRCLLLDEYCVISGAAMVLYGVKHNTPDVDLICTPEFGKRLQKEGYEIISTTTGFPNRILMEEISVEILLSDLPEEIDIIDGIRISSLNEIIKFKGSLGREKDINDIKLIKDFISHKELKEKKLEKLLQNCCSNIPYYKKMLNTRGKNSIGLSEMPFVTKKEYICEPNAFISSSIKGDLLWEFTSGSTGEPLHICKTKKERIIQNWILQTCRRENGLDIANSTIIRFHNYVNQNLSILTEPTIYNQQIYFPVLYFNDENLKKLENLIIEQNKVWIYGTPSQVEKLALLVKKSQNFIAEKIVYIELYGEMLFPYQKQIIEDIFKCPIRSMYGCHEVWGMAYECRCGNLHVLENHVFIEVLDDKQHVLGYDKEGELAITSLNQESMSFVRYRIGDRGMLHKTTCDCGSFSDELILSSARVADDICLENGKKISSIVFLHILTIINKDQLHLLQFQAEQNSYNHFTVKVVLAENGSKEFLQTIFYQVLCEVLQRNIVISFKYCREIENSGKTGKLKYFIPMKKGTSNKNE